MERKDNNLWTEGPELCLSIRYYFRAEEAAEGVEGGVAAAEEMEERSAAGNRPADCSLADYRPARGIR